MLLPLLARNGVDAAEAEKLLSTLPDPDQVLAVAMGRVPVALGFILTDHGETRAPAQKAGFAFAGDNPLGRCRQFHPGGSDLPVFEAAAAGDGFLNQLPEWDHVVRRLPLVLKLNGKPYPSLAAEALRLAFGASTYIGRGVWLKPREQFRTGHRLDRDPDRPADCADRCSRAGLAALCATSARPQASRPPTCSPENSRQGCSPAISC